MLKPIPTLFEGAPNVASQLIADARTGTVFDVKGDGRGVTGRVRLTGDPNRFGLRECGVSYRIGRSRDWAEERREQAFVVAAYWFKVIGNLDHIDTPLMKHIIQRLRQGRTVAGLLVAVREYAGSDWHNEKGVWMQARRFFMQSDVILKWLTKSSEWKAHVARHRDGATNRAATVRERPPRTNRPSPTPDRQSVRALTDTALRAEYRKVLADHQGHELALAAHYRACAPIYERAWNYLPDDVHRRLYGEVEREFAAGHCRPDGTAAFDHDSGEFRRELHRRAWLMLTVEDSQQRRAFKLPAFRPPRPTARSLADKVEPEVRRRACVGFSYPAGSRRSWSDSLRASIEAAEADIITDWLGASPEPAR